MIITLYKLLIKYSTKSFFINRIRVFDQANFLCRFVRSYVRFVRKSNHLFVNVSVGCFSFVCPFVCSFICLSVCSSVRRSVCLSVTVHSFVHASIYPSVLSSSRPSVSLFVRSFIHLFVGLTQLLLDSRGWGTGNTFFQRILCVRCKSSKTVHLDEQVF